jgi:hypothetical protein
VNSGIEDLELSTGYFMSNTDINNVIQQMSSYATSHGIALTSLDTVKNNQDLMAIMNAGWHT